VVTKKAEQMLRLMDRATALWHIPIIGRAKARLLWRLIDRYRPENALEIGSLVGYSAIVIAGSLPPRGRLTCIEQNGFLARLVKANAEEAGLGKRVKVIVGDALRVIPCSPGDSTWCSSTLPRRITSTTFASSRQNSRRARWWWRTTRASPARRWPRIWSTCATVPAVIAAVSTTSATTPWK
jgi:O-methyltransferase